MLPRPASRYTPQQAQENRASRKEARTNFLSFCQYVDKSFETPPHVQLLASKLQQVALYILSGGTKGIGRLMILMPPQHGKSQLCSRLFPAFLLGVYPDCRIILTSYGADLAAKNSRTVRDMVDGEYYQALFGRKSSNKFDPVEVSVDSRSAIEWDLAQPHQGGVKAAGVGGGITGLGAHLFVLDDPFKNREEAESENQRELVDGWWKSSARTRLRPNGAIIVFHTRWHPDDQAGRLIQKMVSEPEADQYDIVSLPALALDEYPTDQTDQRKKMRDGVFMPLADPLGRKAGEALWPTRYSREYLRSTRADVGLYDFEALYQQNPFLMEGNMFKRDWFTIVDKGPDAAYARVRAWDKAATSGGGARSASVLMSWGTDDYVYIEHVSAEQMSSAERDERMVSLGREDYGNYGAFVILHPQDPGSAGLDSARASNDLLANSGLIGDFEPVTGDKVTNAGPLATKAKGGRVRLVRGGWNDRFLDEAASFPKGRFKDQIDAGSTAFNYLRPMVEELKAQAAFGDTFVYEERVNISPV